MDDGSFGINNLIVVLLMGVPSLTRSEKCCHLTLVRLKHDSLVEIAVDLY